MSPEISIIIPAYNAEKTILTTLLSINNQDFESYEVIVINDGSNDDTEMVVRDFQSKHGMRIVYYYQENSGVSAARNKGIEISKGKYIFFVDGDDTVEPGALSRLYCEIEKNDVDMVVGSYKVVNNNCTNFYSFPVEIVESEEFFKKVILRIIVPGVGNTLFDKNILTENNIWFINTAYGEDGDFFRKTSFHVKKASIIPDILYNYIATENSAMTKKYTEKRNDSIVSVFSTISYLKEHNCKEEFIELMNISLIRDIKVICLLILDSITSFLNVNKIIKVRKILNNLPKRIDKCLFALNIFDKKHVKFFFYMPLTYCFLFRIFQKLMNRG